MSENRSSCRTSHSKSLTVLPWLQHMRARAKSTEHACACAGLGADLVPARSAPKHLCKDKARDARPTFSQAYATVMNRGGRRPSLGRNEDRLRGGFQASMLPSHSYASSGVSQSNVFGGNQATNSGSGSSSSNSTVIIQQLGEPSEVDSGETGSAIGSVRVYCRGACQKSRTEGSVRRQLSTP